MKTWLKHNSLIIFGIVAGVLVACYPLVAFPQDVAPQPDGTLPWLQWLPSIIGAVVAVAGALGLWVLLRAKLGLLGDWLAAKTKLSVLAQIDEVLVAAASAVYEEGTDWLGTAAADGKITPDEWAGLKARIWERAKQMVSVDELAGYFGGSAGAAADYAKGRIPHAIAQSTARGDGARRVGPDPTRP